MGRKRWMGAVALVAVLGVSAAAIAGGWGPKIDPIEATITYTFVEVDYRSCEGPGDEWFTEQRVRVSGIAEGDRRLAGAVELRLRLLNKDSTGESFQEGKLVVRDPDTGRKKVVARFTDVGSGDIFQGMVAGTVKRGAKALFANWRTTFHPNGAITGQIGGSAADGRLPAIVTKGRCTGSWYHLEFELPPPEPTLATARRAANQRVGWLYR